MCDFNYSKSTGFIKKKKKKGINNFLPRNILIVNRETNTF